MQQYADIYLLLNYSTCFGRPSHPSSGVPKTVFAASATDHTVWGASFFKRDQILLMMGAMDARNMYGNLAVKNICKLFASCWISSTQNYDARKYKYKIHEESVITGEIWV